MHNLLGSRGGSHCKQLVTGLTLESDPARPSQNATFGSTLCHCTSARLQAYCPGVYRCPLLIPLEVTIFQNFLWNWSIWGRPQRSIGELQVHVYQNKVLKIQYSKDWYTATICYFKFTIYFLFHLVFVYHNKITIYMYQKYSEITIQLGKSCMPNTLETEKIYI